MSIYNDHKFIVTTFMLEKNSNNNTNNSSFNILNVTGNTTLHSDLNVTGNTTLHTDLNVSGNTTLHTDLNVSGTTNLNGNLIYNGIISCKKVPKIYNVLNNGDILDTLYSNVIINYTLTSNITVLLDNGSENGQILEISFNGISNVHSLRIENINLFDNLVDNYIIFGNNNCKYAKLIYFDNSTNGFNSGWTILNKY